MRGLLGREDVIEAIREGGRGERWLYIFKRGGLIRKTLTGNLCWREGSIREEGLIAREGALGERGLLGKGAFNVYWGASGYDHCDMT